jgi:hypothetical protein
MSVFWRNGVAFASFSIELVRLYVQWPPGIGWGAAGGLGYFLAKFLGDYQEGFPEGRHWGLYLVEMTVRVILGAVVGAATLAFGQGGAFVAGLAGPQALVSLGAKFGRRKSRPGGKEAAPDADARQNAKNRT